METHLSQRIQQKTQGPTLKLVGVVRRMALACLTPTHMAPKIAPASRAPCSARRAVSSARACFSGSRARSLLIATMRAVARTTGIDVDRGSGGEGQKLAQKPGRGRSQPAQRLARNGESAGPAEGRRQVFALD
eukprot:12735059-Alexandrium_andersonii.AAC.1